MATRRTYGEACGIPRALDRVGERWSLMIVRELVLGPKRFTDLREGLPKVSPDVLAQRLRELEDFGIVAKRKLPPPAASQVYELTDWGLELEPVLIALGRWGARAPMNEEPCGMSLDSHVLSLQTLYDPALAEGLEATLELVLDGQPFHAELSASGLDIERGEAVAPHARIETDPTTLIEVSHRHRKFDDAVRAGDLMVTGDKRLAKRFFGFFPLPEPALQ